MLRVPPVALRRCRRPTASSGEGHFLLATLKVGRPSSTALRCRRRCANSPRGRPVRRVLPPIQAWKRRGAWAKKLGASESASASPNRQPHGRTRPKRIARPETPCPSQDGAAPVREDRICKPFADRLWKQSHTLDTKALSERAGGPRRFATWPGTVPRRVAKRRVARGPGGSGRRLGARPRDRATAAAQASVMTTGVPSCTWWNSHSASGMCIRMQPCEAE